MTMKPEDIALGNGNFEAATEWCHDTEWRNLDDHLPLGVLNRLAKANRSLFASNRIAEMLVKDMRGKADARDDDRVKYSGLNTVDVEALALAMLELGGLAEDMLTEIRESADGYRGR